MTFLLQRVRWVAIVALLGVLFLPTLSEAKHTAESGMKGKTRATICEWNRRHTRLNCDQENVPATIVVLHRESGQEQSRITSDGRGRFSASLPTGTYRLESDSDNLRVFPSEVTITEGKVLRTNLYLNGALEQTLGR